MKVSSPAGPSRRMRRVEAVRGMADAVMAWNPEKLASFVLTLKRPRRPAQAERGRRAGQSIEHLSRLTAPTSSPTRAALARARAQALVGEDRGGGSRPTLKFRAFPLPHCKGRPLQGSARPPSPARPGREPALSSAELLHSIALFSRNRYCGAGGNAGRLGGALEEVD